MLYAHDKGVERSDNGNGIYLFKLQIIKSLIFNQTNFYTIEMGLFGERYLWNILWRSRNIINQIALHREVNGLQN